MLHVRDVADAIQVIIELKCIEGGCEVVLGGSGLGEAFGIGPGVLSDRSSRLWLDRRIPAPHARSANSAALAEFKGMKRKRIVLLLGAHSPAAHRQVRADAACGCDSGRFMGARACAEGRAEVHSQRHERMCGGPRAKRKLDGHYREWRPGTGGPFLRRRRSSPTMAVTARTSPIGANQISITTHRLPRRASKPRTPVAISTAPTNHARATTKPSALHNRPRIRPHMHASVTAHAPRTSA